MTDPLNLGLTTHVAPASAPPNVPLTLHAVETELIEPTTAEPEPVSTTPLSLPPQSDYPDPAQHTYTSQSSPPVQIQETVSVDPNVDVHQLPLGNVPFLVPVAGPVAAPLEAYHISEQLDQRVQTLVSRRRLPSTLIPRRNEAEALGSRYLNRAVRYGMLSRATDKEFKYELDMLCILFSVVNYIPDYGYSLVETLYKDFKEILVRVRTEAWN